MPNSSIFKDRITAIFGTEAITDYEEHRNSDSVSMVLRLPTNVWLDLPKQLDSLVDVLGKRDVRARFVGSDGMERALPSFDLRVNLSSADAPGKVKMERRFKLMQSIDLLAAMDEVTEKVGHRNLKANFNPFPLGSHVYMMINAACTC